MNQNNKLFYNSTGHITYVHITRVLSDICGEVTVFIFILYMYVHIYLLYTYIHLYTLYIYTLYTM